MLNEFDFMLPSSCWSEHIKILCRFFASSIELIDRDLNDYAEGEIEWKYFELKCQSVSGSMTNRIYWLE